jgi:hypothetical protein
MEGACCPSYSTAGSLPHAGHDWYGLVNRRHVDGLERPTLAIRTDDLNAAGGIGSKQQAPAPAAPILDHAGTLAEATISA